MADRRSRNNQRKLRDEASASLDELRQKLEISPLKTPNRRQKNSDSQSSPYSASVERLKELIKRHERSSNHRKSSGNDSLLNLDVPLPDELAPLLNDQHTLLQHLEGQVSYYKDALNMLKQKAEIVIDENNRLHEQLVSGIQDEIGELDGSQSMIEAPLRNSMTECATQTDKHKTNETKEGFSVDFKENDASNDGDSTLQNVQKGFMASRGDESRAVNSEQLEPELAKLKDLHAIKTKQLETMLRSTREQLDENTKYIKTLEAKLSQADGADAPIIKSEIDKPGLCVKCAHNKAVLSGFQTGINEKILKRIERENNELLETVNKQRSMLVDVRKREVDAFIQVKKSCELAEEVQLQKQEITIKYQQATAEIQRLKDENKKQIFKANNSAQKEKIKLQNENEENLGRLTKQLDDIAEKLSRTEIQLERVTREKLDLKTSLTKLEDYTENHDKEMIKKLDEVRYSLTEANEENLVLKQQIQRLDADKKGMEIMLEKKDILSNDEVNSLRKRLSELTEKLDVTNQECIQLTEEHHRCQKQFQADRTSRDQELAAYKNQYEQLRVDHKQRVEQLLNSLREAEENHVRTKTELESMLESQIKISNSFKEECKILFDKQEEFQAKTRLCHDKMSEENRVLKKEFSVLKNENKDLSGQGSELHEQVKYLKKCLKDAELQAKAYSEKAINLLSRYNNVLKERQHLFEEVEFLRNQLPAYRNSLKNSISDLDSTEQPS